VPGERAPRLIEELGSADTLLAQPVDEEIGGRA
jgi:hypothetical protein